MEGCPAKRAECGERQSKGRHGKRSIFWPPRLTLFNNLITVPKIAANCRKFGDLNWTTSLYALGSPHEKELTANHAAEFL
jgi:hypothetical protein